MNIIPASVPSRFCGHATCSGLRGRSWRRAFRLHRRCLATLAVTLTALSTTVMGGASEAAESTGSNLRIWGAQSFNRQIEPDAVVRQAVGGFDFTVVVLEDGSVAAWGRNDAGQCDVPSDVGTPERPVAQIAVGFDHVVAILEDEVPGGVGIQPVRPVRRSGGNRHAGESGGQRRRGLAVHRRSPGRRVDQLLGKRPPRPVSSARGDRNSGATCRRDRRRWSSGRRTHRGGPGGWNGGLLGKERLRAVRGAEQHRDAGESRGERGRGVGPHRGGPRQRLDLLLGPERLRSMRRPGPVALLGFSRPADLRRVPTHGGASCGRFGRLLGPRRPEGPVSRTAECRNARFAGRAGPRGERGKRSQHRGPGQR